MLTTVGHVVERMNGLMLQLRTGSSQPVDSPRHVDLNAVVRFYDRRFQMGLTPQEAADLAAFLKAL